MSGGPEGGAGADRAPVQVTATGVAGGGPTRADLVGTALLAVLGLAAAVYGWRYGFLVDGQVGAGFLPVATGGFIAVASTAEIVRMGLQRRATRADDHVRAPVGDERAAAVPTGQAAPDEELDVFGRTAAQRGRAIAVVFGLLGAALLLVPLIGLLLSLSLAVLVLVLVVERKGPVAAVASAAACLAFGWLVFVQVLGAPLPSGALGLV
ncbi:tripartite tricarboxylate transporter TctB family protein [Pseudokineococcus marinus]|uniref:DUF1468 domain-containing protein n=1 Tax=Pseudokineococcus marinus TaxID=351215 RepID=A0A849BHL5_9ACTN|nr:tripartite tricarboxylate transporter TctB family protein [Pseudokineococcus marinus]NNH22639.1 hypothetical protein [Pseudokineococcus marinus]